MSETVSRYFSSKLVGKRKSSSTSSDSSSPTELKPHTSERQDKKKQKTVVESSGESKEDVLAMEEMKATLDCMNQKLGLMCLKEDIEKLTETMNRRVELLESSLFDLQQQKDRLNEEVGQLKQENTSLRSQLETVKKETRELRAAQNDTEQHGRLWSVRLYGVAEARQPKEETVDDCVKKALEVFNQKLGAKIRPEDVEIAHRLGQPGHEAQRTQGSAGKPRPIILRFLSRQKRGQVLQNRRKLKNSGISISEDLTLANYKLLKQASVHSATLSAWSSQGKVIAKLKNGKIVRLTITKSVDEQLRSAMAQ